jgi:hypothetical protein
MDEETWRFINTFAPWLSALGTLAAVITSLYLARRHDRIALKITLGVREVAVRGGGPEHGTVLVWLNIKNIGRRSATITSLHWQPVPWSKKGLIWLAQQNAYSSRFPVTLGDGEEANYAVPLEEFRTNFKDHARNLFSGICGAVRVRLLKISVYTSTGAIFKRKPEKPLREFFRRLAKEQHSHKEGTV